MADEEKTEVTLNLVLTPTSGAEQPIVANCSKVHVVHGMLYLDFGFIEPAKIVSISRDRQVPKDGTIEAKLLVRVAMPPESAEGFQRKLNGILGHTLIQENEESET